MFQNKSREELISELQELQEKYTALKQSAENELFDINRRGEALKASEEKFQQLFMKAPLGYQSLDFDGNFIEVNQQWLDTLGYVREEVIGKWFGDFLSPAYQDGFRKRFPVFKAQGHIHSEFEMIHKNGSLLFIAFDGRIGYDANGDFLQTHCILQDITEKKQNENLLKESEERFKLAMKASNDGLFDWNLETNEIYYSPGWKKMLGYADHELQNDFSVWEKLTRAEDVKKSWDLQQRLISKQTDRFVMEFKMKHKKGHWVDILSRSEAIFDDRGKAIRIVGNHTDITEQKQAESIFRDIIEKNPMSIQILDMEGYTIQTNSAHTKLFGVTPPAGYSVFKDEQLLQQGFGEVFDRIKTGEVVYFPDSAFNVHDIDTSFPDITVAVKALGFTLNDNNGKPERIVIMHENITDRKHAENMSHDIIENNPISIQIVDKGGHIIHGNPAFTKLFGVLPPPDFSIFDDLCRKGPELEKLILRAKSGEVVHFPDMFYNPRDISPDFPDKPVWIRAMIFPLMNSSGRPDRFVLMHEDFTQRWRVENELRLLNETLETRIAERTSQLETTNTELAFHLNEVEQFSYIASHDLQEPLRTLTTYTQLMKEEYAGKLDADGLRYIEYISGSATRMRALVSALLEYSLLGKESIITTVDCNKILAEVLDDMSDSIKKNQVTLSFQELPVIQAYETELRLLFQNLINNAVKFHKTDVLPVVKISAVSRSKDWLFKIEDNGIGIEEKNKEKIFIIFKRMHKRNDFEGAGIGLAHCKKIVELHGGKIWVESAIGVGSTFLFTIPKRD